MVDMAATIIPRSDQMNADDLIAGPRTIKITAVKADPGSSEQPILIHYEGDGGKPYKACKSMRRVMVAIWGADGSQFVGRSMTLYRDPSVKWGGMEVGGIRISHMSDMDAPVTMALTATKQSRKPYTVRPLEVVASAKDDPIAIYGRELNAAIKAGTATEFWTETTERRDALGIPAERLAKMQAAVKPKEGAE